MTTRRALRPIVAVLSLAVLVLADVSPEAPLGLTLVRDASAIVGAPATPLSVAGVARRTTYRAVATTTAVASTAAATTAAATTAQQQAVAQQQAAVAQQQAAVAQQQAAVARQQAAASPAVGTVVSTLPAGCVATPKGGIEYQKCGDVYFRAAFQGNNLVYVVVQP
jgi:biotin carboxyl carrier protein